MVMEELDETWRRWFSLQFQKVHKTWDVGFWNPIRLLAEEVL